MKKYIKPELSIFLLEDVSPIVTVSVNRGGDYDGRNPGIQLGIPRGSHYIENDPEEEEEIW